MNGWAETDPAWWLNLQGRPEAIVELKGGTSRPIRARAALGEERRRLWTKLSEHTGWGDTAAFAALRSGETAVVIFEPVLTEALDA